MRKRLPLLLLALTVLIAFVAAGCGDDKSADVTSVPSGATQSSSSSKGWTGSGGDPKKSTKKSSTSGAATESAQKTLDSCLTGAESIPDKDQAASAKRRCQEAYANIQESSAQIDKATSDARAQCEAAANKISNEQAKASTLAACAQFK
jgi:hypothetical protein